MTIADSEVDAVAEAIRNGLLDQSGYESVSQIDIDCTELANRALKASAEARTVGSAANIPVKAVAYNHADGSIVARFDQDHGVVFGDDRPFPWKEQYLRGPLRLLWRPDSEPASPDSRKR